MVIAYKLSQILNLYGQTFFRQRISYSITMPDLNTQVRQLTLYPLIGWTNTMPIVA
jgi:hypothetical protein